VEPSIYKANFDSTKPKFVEEVNKLHMLSTS